MDAISVLIKMLKERNVITPLEQDILNTYHELTKNPFERNSAIRQVQKNNVNHPEIFIAISTSPATVLKPWDVVSDEEICSNLTSQLEALVEKEREVQTNAQQA